MEKRVPIKPFEFVDQVTGQKISVSASEFYTTLHIDSRDYYFVRETGDFDGTGSVVAE